MPRIAFRAFFLLSMLCGGAQADEDMGLSIDRNGVKVWTYHVADYPLLGFRATTVVHSTLAGLVTLITDTEHTPDWAYRVERIDMIRRDDDAETFVIRAITNFWPLKDRDVYIQGRVTQDPQTLKVTIDSQSTPAGMFPVSSDYVRMPDMQGRWEFRPLGNGLVEVTTSGRADPGGAIPHFLINMFVQEMPYNTLLSLRKAIQDDRYQHSQQKMIREPNQ